MIHQCECELCNMNQFFFAPEFIIRFKKGGLPKRGSYVFKSALVFNTSAALCLSRNTTFKEVDLGKFLQAPADEPFSRSCFWTNENYPLPFETRRCHVKQKNRLISLSPFLFYSYELKLFHQPDKIRRWKPL